MTAQQLFDSFVSSPDPHPRYFWVPALGSVRVWDGVVYVDDPSPYGYYRKANKEQMAVIEKLFTEP